MTKILNKIISVTSFKPIDDSTEAGRSKERYRRITVSTMAAFIAKGSSTLTMLIMTPLVYKHLDIESFGLLMTITSLLAVMQYADFGIGNGLLNAISEAHGQNDQDKATKAVSNSLVMLTAIAVIISVLYAGAHRFIDWGRALNVSSTLAVEAGRSMDIFVVCLVLSLPLLTAQRVQMGYQEGFQANLWAGLGSLFVLVGVSLSVWLNAGLVWLVLAVVGAPVMAMGLNCLHQFLYVRPWMLPRLNNVEWLLSKHLLKIGAVWMMFQVMAFVGTGADNLIIGSMFGQKSVAGYAVMTKLLSGLMIAQFFSAPLWPAFAEALERGDLEWARKTYRRALLLCTSIGIAGAAALVFFSRWIVGIWVGQEVVPSISMVLGFAAWCFICNMFASISALMANNRLLIKQLVLVTFAALISLTLKFILAPIFGVTAIIWSSVIGYGLICLPALILIQKVLRQPLEHNTLYKKSLYACNIKCGEG